MHSFTKTYTYTSKPSIIVKLNLLLVHHHSINTFFSFNHSFYFTIRFTFFSLTLPLIHLKALAMSYQD
jgi:hypothetical protein